MAQELLIALVSLKVGSAVDVRVRGDGALTVYGRVTALCRAANLFEASGRQATLRAMNGLPGVEEVAYKLHVALGFLVCPLRVGGKTEDLPRCLARNFPTTIAKIAVAWFRESGRMVLLAEGNGETK